MGTGRSMAGPAIDLPKNPPNNPPKNPPKKSCLANFMGAICVPLADPSDRAIRMRVASVTVGPCPSYLPTHPRLRPPEPI